MKIAVASVSKGKLNKTLCKHNIGPETKEIYNMRSNVALKEFTF